MSGALVDFEPEQRERAQALADELRVAIEALATRAPASDQLDEALVLARALHAKLDGPRRPSWYENDESDEPQRHSFIDKSPVSGDVNALAPRFERGEATHEGCRCVEMRTTLSRSYEGPPLGVHGGWVAAIFDEILGAAQKFVGAPGVTAILEVKYRKVTPIEVPLVFRAWIESDHGRRVVAHATCEAQGRVTASAEAVFMRVDFDAVEARMREGD